MRLNGLTDDELADVWYALAGAELRHPGCFTALLEKSHAELSRRLGDKLASFVEQRFKKLRPVDALEDARANEMATSEASCEDGAEFRP